MINWIDLPDKPWWTKVQNRKWKILMQKMEELDEDEWLIFCERRPGWWWKHAGITKARPELDRREEANRKIKLAIWKEIDTLWPKTADEIEQIPLDNPDEIF